MISIFQLQRTDDFIHQMVQSCDSGTLNEVRQVYLLVNSKRSPYGKPGGKKYIVKFEKSTSTSIISCCWAFPKVTDCSLEQMRNDKNFIRALNNLMNDVFEPGALLTYDLEEFWKCIEQACNNASVDSATGGVLNFVELSKRGMLIIPSFEITEITENFEYVVTSSQTESQIRRMLEIKTECYEIYVELFKTNLPKGETIGDDDITKWHVVARDAMVNKFVGECKRAGLSGPDTEMQMHLLSIEIENFKPGAIGTLMCEESLIHSLLGSRKTRQGEGRGKTLLV